MILARFSHRRHASLPFFTGRTRRRVDEYLMMMALPAAIIYASRPPSGAIYGACHAEATARHRAPSRAQAGPPTYFAQLRAYRRAQPRKRRQSEYYCMLDFDGYDILMLRAQATARRAALRDTILYLHARWPHDGHGALGRCRARHDHLSRRAGSMRHAARAICR